MGYTIETGALIRMAAQMRAAAQTEKLAEAEAIQLAALISEKELKENALNAGRPVRRGLFMESKPGFRLGTRTGVTAASVSSIVTKSAGQFIASVGTPLRHVLANEHGATITPKRGKALAIPTVNALAPSGALSNQFAGLHSLRDARTKSGKKLFVLATKGRAWLAGMEGSKAGTVTRDKRTGRMKRGGRIVLYFLLVTRAEIPARYMFRNARRRIEPVIEEAVGQSIAVRVTEKLK